MLRPGCSCPWCPHFLTQTCQELPVQGSRRCRRSGAAGLLATPAGSGRQRVISGNAWRHLARRPRGDWLNTSRHNVKGLWARMGQQELAHCSLRSAGMGARARQAAHRYGPLGMPLYTSTRPVYPPQQCSGAAVGRPPARQHSDSSYHPRHRKGR